MFDRADKNNDGKLDLDEILQLLRKLNVRSSKTKIKSTLKVRIIFINWNKIILQNHITFLNLLFSFYYYCYKSLSFKYRFKIKTRGCNFHYVFVLSFP